VPHFTCKNETPFPEGIRSLSFFPWQLRTHDY